MDESWFAPICAYCERSDAGFWSEPVNALSNAGFLIAAGAAAWRERTGPRRDPAALALAAIVAVVGLGSFLFHTLANRWSLLADVIPIAVFIYAFFFLAMWRFFGLPVLTALGATLLFAAFNLGLEPMLDALTGRSMVALTNGSILYLPAFLALVGVGAGLMSGDEARRRVGFAMLGIAALFLLSLSFRTADLALCGRIPTGTHFLWHLLNAGVLFALIVTAMRVRPSGA